MNRRTLLKTLLLLPPAFAFLPSRHASVPRSCPVAGARYHEPPDDLRRGDVVELRRTEFRGGPAIGVFRGERQLGWIPKAMLSHVPPQLTRATLTRVRLDEIPWRWYRLSFA
jgi:hypothetical protein